MFTVSKPIQDRAIVTVEMPVGNRRLSIWMVPFPLSWSDLWTRFQDHDIVLEKFSMTQSIARPLQLLSLLLLSFYCVLLLPLL